MSNEYFIKNGVPGKGMMAPNKPGSGSGNTTTYAPSVSSERHVYTMQNLIIQIDSLFKKNKDNTSFNDFVINHFVDPTVAGHEATSKTGKDVDTKIDSEKLQNMKTIMNSLRGVGSITKDATPDNDWGSKTNNALKNVYAITAAFIDVDRALNLNSGDVDLSSLKTIIDKHPTIKELKEQRNNLQKDASELKEPLEKIIAFFQSFYKKLNSSDYKEKINQDNLFNFDPNKADEYAMSANENDFLKDQNQTTVTPVPGVSINTSTGVKQVMLSSLMTKENFANFLKQMNPGPKVETTTFVNALNQIASQLGIAGATASETPAAARR